MEKGELTFSGKKDIPSVVTRWKGKKRRMNKDAGKLSALVAGSWTYASDSGFTFSVK